MTFACFPVFANALKNQSSSGGDERFFVSEKILSKLSALSYDPRDIPAHEKFSLTSGMSMTEKQGGSDVRANTTTAKPLDHNSGQYELFGHKFFTSAPQSDVFLTLARTKENDDASLSCFVVPRWMPNGERNTGLRFQRLKNKLGNLSNASSEVEYHGAWGELIGEEGKGIKTIMTMVAHTRLDCALGSAGQMRQCVVQAVNHCRQRSAFGNLLSNQPIMQNVLADLVLETEASALQALYLAHVFDTNPSLARILTPITKYWVCKRLPMVAYEALECFGGNGYVEDSSMMPRLYRDAPLNSIWEGSGNVQALDVLRVVQKNPESLQEMLNWLGSVGKQASNQHFNKALASLVSSLDTMMAQGTNDLHTLQVNIRWIVSQLALLSQSAVLLQHNDTHQNKATNLVVEHFTRSRLSSIQHGHGGLNFGTLNNISESDLNRIISRSIVHHD
eukprot:CAMPEP_0201562132 /NCGR_PEP_ID=MMETSP0173_2-20130828/79158_1 /ASSEMBLY_ACC=CAM_ASM_000268 /TAXON_ID=218659 /ORGANISM="Vexillifera sp., Strain DIVA3 564/2" /LENGTH=447 /DNA_ID=CAMNT_0047976673 /DNA_START=443 /DNA_END=1786 /DNA_ORIENTATION=-